MTDGGAPAAAAAAAPAWRLCALLAAAALLGARAEPTCPRVRAAFQALQPGARGVLESPGPGERAPARTAPAGGGAGGGGAALDTALGRLAPSLPACLP